MTINSLNSLSSIAMDTIARKNPFPRLEGFATNGDACHWWFDELYPESENVLRKALEEKATFDTGWVGSKKEICSFRIISDGKVLTLQTSASMDDIEDLFYDAAPNGVEFTEEQTESLMDYYHESDVDTTAGSEITIPYTTYEEVLKNLCEMSKCDFKQLDEWFEEVKQWVEEVVSTGQ